MILPKCSLYKKSKIIDDFAFTIPFKNFTINYTSIVSPIAGKNNFLPVASKLVVAFS
jgi:hypothetical protein